MFKKSVTEEYKKRFLNSIEQGEIKLHNVVKCECGASNFEYLSHVDRFELEFATIICKYCGLVMTTPQISPSSLIFYYQHYYHPLHYNKIQFDSNQVLFGKGQGKKIFHKLEPYLPRNKKLKVLEIGAGTGNVLSEFRDKAQPFYTSISLCGIEFNKQCQKLCREKDIILVDDVNTLIQANTQFDIVILSHVFEHCVDLHQELLQIQQLLKKDGILYIEVPGILVNHTKKIYNFSYKNYVTHAHMYNFTAQTLKNIVKKFQFSCLEINEEVEAIFQYNDKILYAEEDDILTDNYSTIRFYLNFLQQNHHCFAHPEELIDSKQFYVIKKEKSSLNYDFSVKLNRLEKMIITLKKEDKRIAIYGYGIVGKLAASMLGANLSFIVDKDESKTDDINIFPPLELVNAIYDYIFITVLGRELEIKKFLCEELLISEDKILTLDISK